MGSLAADYFQLRLQGRSPFNLARFAARVVRHGKSAEAASFACWEIMHRLRLQRRVSFTADDPLRPAEGLLNLDRQTASGAGGFRFVSAVHPWLFAYRRGSTEYGALYTERSTLYAHDRHTHDRCSHNCPTTLWRFDAAIRSVHATSGTAILVSTDDGQIHRYDAETGECEPVQQLSTPASYLRFDSSTTEAQDGMVIMAEYGNVRAGKRWRSVAYLYFSIDDGKTWSTSDVLIKAGINKHSHFVRYSHRTGTVMLSVGDNKKQVLEGSLSQRDGKAAITWRRCNRWHHQTGGYTSVAETPDGFLFGSDYHYGTNFIVKSADCERFDKASIPDPYRRSPVFGMTKRTSGPDGEIWASLYSSMSTRTKSLVMMTKDRGQTWQRILEYDGTANRIYLASGGDAPTDYGRLLLHITAVSGDEGERPVATYQVMEAGANKKPV